MKNRIILFLIFMSTFNCRIDNNSNQSSSGRFRIDRYHENGKLKSRVWYNQENESDSLGLWFYESGKLEVKAQFSKGKQIGPTVFYYPNGNIERYCFFNNTGDDSAMYVVDYNENGEIIKERGQPIGIYHVNGLKIPVNEYLDFEAIVAFPPDAKMILKVGVKEGGTDFNFGNIYEVRNDLIPFFRHYFEHKGEFPMMVVSELNDTIRNTIRRDTINFTVRVD